MKTMRRNLRLTALIAKEIKKAGSPYRLARKIDQANIDAGTGLEISHRTLRKIAERPETVSLTLNVLTALDAYFAPLGESLQEKPIFEKKGILECLVEKRKVSFLLGSRPRLAARRNDLSRWDTRSLAELLSQACRFDMHVDYEIEDVILSTPMNAQKAAAEKWHQVLADDTRSLVAIGSPRACLASEVMLARMFGATAFQAPVPSVAAKNQMPFFFAWPPHLSRHLRSAFALSWRELKALDEPAAQAVMQNKASAFVSNSKVYTVAVGGNQWEMYGVIVAQRRSAGNVWLVISGLTGPATYAAATLVKKVDAELPMTKGKDSTILWLPVRAIINADQTRKHLGDNRDVDSVEAMSEPQFWQKPEQPEPPK